MRLVKLPSTRLYWETHMSYNGVSSILSKSHFNTILHNLHSVTKDAYCAWKIHPWLSSLRENFLKVSPEEFQSMDEIMVGFRGLSLLRQYMPNKPRKWGFKLWRRSGVSVYLYDFNIYQGKEVKINN